MQAGSRMAAHDAKQVVGGALLRAGAVAALAVTLVAAGFCACLAPSATEGLSRTFAWEDVSPFNRDQLSRVALAVRDYAFGSHDFEALLRTEYAVNSELAASRASTPGLRAAGAPDLSGLDETASADELAGALSTASDVYALDSEAVSHLDDCNAVARAIYPALAIVALLALVACIHLGRERGRRALGGVFVGGAGIVLGAFLAAGVWALIDFYGFFTAFHRLFFSAGTWEFSAQSLLICALPTEFWMGMGTIWLAVTALVAILLGCVGIALRRAR